MIFCLLLCIYSNIPIIYIYIYTYIDISYRPCISAYRLVHIVHKASLHALAAQHASPRAAPLFLTRRKIPGVGSFCRKNVRRCGRLWRGGCGRYDALLAATM